MRNLFLLLVLGNSGFVAWTLWYAEPATDVRVVQKSAGSDISLVDEVTESPSEPPGVEVAVSPVEELAVTLGAKSDLPIARCIGIGPFSELVRFAQVMTILNSAGYAATRRSEDGDVWLGHWVYLNYVTTPGQAETISAVLAEHGIVDTYFDPAGEDGEVLSLGVFREFERAETIRDRVLGLGFDPEMTDRTRPGTLYWADLTLQSEENLDLEPLQAAGRIIRLEQRVCDAPDG